MADHTYKLFTDGSCLGNPGVGGIGVFLAFPDDLIHEDIRFYRGYHQTSNNRMELRAAIEGLKIVRGQIKLNGYRPVEWKTDSQYVAGNLLNVPGWRKGGAWIRSNGEPVLNPDLWGDLFNLSYQMRVSPIWIDREHNKEADFLAKQGSLYPTYTDFGFNPGRIGKPIGKRGKAPLFFDKDENVRIRIYKGDGQVSRADKRCKIRFELPKTTGDEPIEKFYAYTQMEIYHLLQRNHEYVVEISDGEIVKIIEKEGEDFEP